MLHTSQFGINHAIQKCSPLPRQLRLQSLLDQRSNLLLGHIIEINLSQAVLNSFYNHHIIWPGVTALEIELRHWAEGFGGHWCSRAAREADLTAGGVERGWLT